MSGAASALEVGPGPKIATIGIVNALEMLGLDANGACVGIARAALLRALRDADLAGLVAAPDATLTWTTQAGIKVTHAGAKQVITVPAVADVTSWPVGESRTLQIQNVGGFGVGFAAIADVGFNLAAVNNAIVTLTGSNVVPGVAVNVPTYTVYRASAASYLISVGA